MIFPRDEIAARGFAVLRSDGLSADEAARAPWIFAERVLGARPRMVERQPIKAVPFGRSFASSAGPVPVHTDSQIFAGSAPDVQIMVCVRAADRGGDHVLVDGWALLDHVRAVDPDLYRTMFETPRRIPFVFGDVFGPTVALRGGSLTFTHSPMAVRADAIATRLAPFVDAATRIEFATSAGDVLIVHNHRMLHGRRAFEGDAREYVRLLVWSTHDFGAPDHHRAYATQVATSASARLTGAPEAVRRRLGLALPRASDRRLAVVLEMLRGVPPGVLASREDIPEPELYRMRDVALAAAEAALASPDLPASDDHMVRAISGKPG